MKGGLRQFPAVGGPPACGEGGRMEQRASRAVLFDLGGTLRKPGAEIYRIAARELGVELLALLPPLA